MGNSCSTNVAVRDEAHIKAAAPAESVPQPDEYQDAAALLLGHLNLEVYLPAFHIAGYTRPEQLVQLSAQDLDVIEQRSHVPILPAHRRMMLSVDCAAWAQEYAGRDGAQLCPSDPSDTLAGQDNTTALAPAPAVAEGSSSAPVKPGSAPHQQPSVGGWFQTGPNKTAAAPQAAAQQLARDQGASPAPGAGDAVAHGLERPDSGCASGASSGSATSSRPSSRQQDLHPSSQLQQVGPLAAGRASFSCSSAPPGGSMSNSGRGSGATEVVPSQVHAAVLQRLQRVRDLSRCHPLPQQPGPSAPPGSSSGAAARTMGAGTSAAVDAGTREVPPLSRALYEAAGVIPRTRPLYDTELQAGGDGGSLGSAPPTSALEGPGAGPLTRQQPAPTSNMTLVVPAATAAALRSPRERAARELLGWAPGGGVTGGTSRVTSDTNQRRAAAGAVQAAQDGHGHHGHTHHQQQQQGQVACRPCSAVDQHGSPADSSSRASSRASSRSGCGSLLQQLGRPGGQHLEDLPLAAYTGGSPSGSATKAAALSCRTEAGGGSSSVRGGPSPSASTASTVGNRLRVGTAAAAAGAAAAPPAGVPSGKHGSTGRNAAAEAAAPVSSSAPASEAAQELLRIVCRAKARLAAKLEASQAAPPPPAAAAAVAAVEQASAGAGTEQAPAQVPAAGWPAVAATTVLPTGGADESSSSSSSRRAAQSSSTAAATTAAAGVGPWEDAEELWEVPLPVSRLQPGQQPSTAATSTAPAAAAGVHTLGGGAVYVRHASSAWGSNTGAPNQTAGVAGVQLESSCGVNAGSRQGRHLPCEEDEVVELGPEFAATAADLDDPTAAPAADVMRCAQVGAACQRQPGLAAVAVEECEAGAAAAMGCEAHMLLPGQVLGGGAASAAAGWDEWARSAVVAAHTCRQMVSPVAPSASAVPHPVQATHQQQQQQQCVCGGWEVSPIVQQMAPRVLEPTSAAASAQHPQLAFTVSSTSRRVSSGGETYDQAVEGGWGSRQDSGVVDVGSNQQEEIRLGQGPAAPANMPATPGGAGRSPAPPATAPTAAAASRRRVSHDDSVGVSDAAGWQRPRSRASSAASGSSRGSGGGPRGKQRPGAGGRDQGGTPAVPAATSGRSRTRPHSSSGGGATVTPRSKAVSRPRPSSAAAAAGAVAAGEEDVAVDAPSSGAAQQQVLRTVRARQKQTHQKSTGSGGRLQQPVFRF